MQRILEYRIGVLRAARMAWSWKMRSNLSMHQRVTLTAPPSSDNLSWRRSRRSAAPASALCILCRTRSPLERAGSDSPMQAAFDYSSLAVRSTRVSRSPSDKNRFEPKGSIRIIHLKRANIDGIPPLEDPELSFRASMTHRRVDLGIIGCPALWSAYLLGNS